MYVMRTGSDLSSCSKGMLYQVIRTDKSTVTFIDNNGDEGIARKNSDKWDFNPDCPNNIGSLMKTNKNVEEVKRETKVVCESSSSSSSSSTDFTTGLLVGGLLF